MLSSFFHTKLLIIITTDSETKKLQFLNVESN